MSKNKGIFISCDEANHSCDKSQYNEASFWERVKLSIHLIYCKACRKYTKNNGKLTELMNKSSVEAMNTNEKTELQKAFDNELTKHQQ